MSKAVVTLNITSRFDSRSVFTVQAYVLKSITSFLPGRKLDKLEFPEFEGIELADPEYNRPNRIDVLLGAELYSQIIQEGIRKEHSGSIVAQSTSLGWILSGALQSSDIYTGVVALHCQLQEGDEILKKFWEIENGIGLTKEESYTEEEKKCEKHFVETTSRDETGRYVVRLPFKTDNPMCIKGESRSITEKRLKGLMKRFEKDKQLQANYKAVMDEYIQMNHMIEIENTDSKRESSLYLAHHPVIREDKKTTKLRIVFNASQAGTNGVSLNDELLVGPSIQPDLRHLVMQWRISRICLTADIIKMYRQIKVDEEDTDFQRLLWIDADSQEVKDYKLLRVTFGTASAPFLAVRTLQQIAIDEGHRYSLAAEKVRSNFYMDDLMCGCETVTEGMEIYKQMTGLLKEAGFELQRWASNNEELMEIIRKGDKDNDEIKQEERNIKMDEVIKILGLTWERSTDNFRYKVNLLGQQSPITKRKIVADISRLFDPLGWIAPCILVAKIMIQRLWIAGISWDDEAPDELLKEWCQFREELSKLHDFRIPRWLGTSLGDVQTELHGFCDASKMAYAAVVYIRRIDSDGNVHVALRP